MNKIVHTIIKEIVRAIAAAVLAVVGLESTGCVASGNGATACFSSVQEGAK